MRVIAGRVRGRRLLAPASEKTRPTGDKLKGAIFSLLEALAYKNGFVEQLDDSGEVRFAAAQAWPRVVDLYAGSGALGIEALSRGAERVEFVEANAKARRLIEENLRITGLSERAAVHALPAEQVVSTLAGAYDLILADPPYADSGAMRVLEKLANAPQLTDRSVLVWEHRRDYEPPPRLGRLGLRRTLRHGLAAVSLYAGDSDRPDRPGGVDSESSA
jgi:16S rRNA (guanine966-N2)-methyltransferase